MGTNYLFVIEPV